MRTRRRPDPATELLADLVQWGYGLLVRLSEQCNLNISDTMALLVLTRRGPMVFKDLADVLGITSGSMTVLADRLVARGALQRCPNPDDRRSLLLQATADGHSLLENLNVPVQTQASKALGNVLRDHRDTIARHLKAVT